MRTIPTTLAVSGAIWARRVAAVQQVQPELLAGHQHSLQRRPLSATAVPSVLRAPQLGEILIRQAAEPQVAPAALPVPVVLVEQGVRAVLFPIVPPAPMERLVRREQVVAPARAGVQADKR